MSHERSQDRHLRKIEQDDTWFVAKLTRDRRIDRNLLVVLTEFSNAPTVIFKRTGN
jgi:hypothetical protein